MSNPQFPADLVTFVEEILNRKLHFLCAVKLKLFQIRRHRSQKHEVQTLAQVTLFIRFITLKNI